jgi:hypothetical protein
MKKLTFRGGFAGAFTRMPSGSCLVALIASFVEQGRLTDHCLTLWIGDKLGPVERACMMSVLRQGHRLALYCYREPIGVPAEIELRDANQVLSEDKVFVHRSGSLAFFSDWFRYELLSRGLGTWVDADMYLLRPLDMEEDYLFGEESPGMINNAVLRLPPDSPMLPFLLEPFEKGRMPTATPLRYQLASRFWQMLGRERHFSRFAWGSTGPLAVNQLARRFGLASKALPPDVLYPVLWSDAEWIRDPRRKLEEVTTERTVGIHLWNHCISSFKNEPAPEGSFLHRLQAEGRE